MMGVLKGAALLAAGIVICLVRPETAAAQVGAGCELRGNVYSSGQEAAEINFSSQRQEDTHIYWIDGNGQESFTLTVGANQRQLLTSTVGHYFSVWDQNTQTCLGVFTVNAAISEILIDGSGAVIDTSGNQSGVRPSQPPADRDSGSGEFIKPGDQGQFSGSNQSTASSAGNAAQQALAKHNELRAQHCVPELQWDAQIAATAQAWADQCVWQHSGNQSYGENLAMATSGYQSVGQMVQNWYDEISSYDFGAGQYSDQTGHFTQVVWRSSTKLGCGVASCNGNDLLVCNYAGPGNTHGQFQQNVPPRCQ